MKKQEIKKDPVRDYIINSYNYFAENKSTLYSVLLVIILIVTFTIIKVNSNKADLLLSNILSSSAQNLYIDGEKELALHKFNKILNGNYNQESINQALIYIIAEAIDNNEDITELLTEHTFKTDDPILNSLYNERVGNYHFNNNNFNEAILHYIIALKSFNSYVDILIDAKLSLIDSYIKTDQLEMAKNEFNNIDVSLLSPTSKTKVTLFGNTFDFY